MQPSGSVAFYLLAMIKIELSHRDGSDRQAGFMRLVFLFRNPVYLTHWIFLLSLAI